MTPAQVYRKRIFWLLSAAVLGPLLFWLGMLQARGPDPVVASVEGQKISRRELDAELEARFGAEVLNDMIDALLIAREARRQGVSLSPSELKEKVDEMLARPEVTARVEAGRLSRRDLERNLTTVLLLDKLIQAGLRPEQVRAYYDGHRAELEQVRMRHILCATEEEAARLLDELHDGADFGKLAREHSLDPTTREQDGDLGFLRRGEVDPELTDAAFSTPVGQLGPVVETRLGYHLILISDKKDNFKLLEPDARQALSSTRRHEFVAALEKSARIERHLPGTAAAPASPSGQEKAP